MRAGVRIGRHAVSLPVCPYLFPWSLRILIVNILIGQILLVAFSSYEILIVIDNLVNHITKHIKIKGKITHFATNLLILQ